MASRRVSVEKRELEGGPKQAEYSRVVAGSVLECARAPEALPTPPPSPPPPPCVRSCVPRARAREPAGRSAGRARRQGDDSGNDVAELGEEGTTLTRLNGDVAGELFGASRHEASRR